MQNYVNTRGLGALQAPTSSLRPFGPAFGPSGLLDFVLRALRALRPCDPRNGAIRSSVKKTLLLRWRLDPFIILKVLFYIARCLSGEIQLFLFFKPKI